MAGTDTILNNAVLTLLQISEYTSKLSFHLYNFMTTLIFQIFVYYIVLLRQALGRVLVANTCNTCYLGGRDQDQSLKPAGQIVQEILSQKYPI
jgi:hypothetical protein